MTAFDYDRADAEQQAALRGEALPSPLDVYDRNHSMAIVINRVQDAHSALWKVCASWRKVSAVYDVPPNVSRKIESVLKALDDLAAMAYEAKEKP